MGDLQCCSLLIASLLFLIFFLHLLKNGFRSRTQNARLPPGPWNLPIIGSMHHLLRSLPHHTLRDLAKIYGPLMYLKLGEVPNIVVSSAEVAKEMMTTHDMNFLSRPSMIATRIVFYGGHDLVFAPYGDFWRQIRKLFVLELLSAKRVQSFQSVREEAAFDLVCSIRSMSPSPVDVSGMLYSFTNNLMVTVAFGNRCGDAKTYMDAIKRTLDLTNDFNVADMFPSLAWVALVTGIKTKLERCRRTMDATIENIILERKERRAAGGESSEENILDVLLNLQARGGLGFPLTADNIKGIIIDIFVGGTGSSATAMLWAMSELMRNPRVLKTAQTEVRGALGGKAKVTEQDVSELQYLKLVIKETLRLHPTGPLLIPRECTATCEVYGYEIPAKANVVFNAWAIGRDPKWWDEPEVFKPERFEGSSVDFRGGNYEFIPFGGGRRMCPGIAFGLANMELPLALLLYHFDWSLPDGVDELDMSETAGLEARRKNDLCLCATPYVGK